MDEIAIVSQWHSTLKTRTDVNFRKICSMRKLFIANYSAEYDSRKCIFSEGEKYLNRLVQTV